MSYVDYAYYTGTYKSAVLTTEGIFNPYERKAELYLNRETFGNITSETIITDGIKMCLCELSDIIYKSENETHDTNIKSEKVGDYSVTYAEQAEIKKELTSKIKETVRLYLNNDADLPLLYRGC